MPIAHKPDAAIVGGKLCLYVGGHYMELSAEVSKPYVRKLQGLDAKLQRQVKRENRKLNREAKA